MINQLHITSDLLHELTAGMRAVAFAPQFGEVYKGSLPAFGEGIPHPAMVRGGLIDRPAGPLVPFAPITSVPKRGNGVLELPKGLLPAKKNVGPVTSYVLLFWPPIKVPERDVRDKYRKLLSLPDRYIADARRIIAGLGK